MGKCRHIDIEFQWIITATGEVYSIEQSIWCERGESNPHTVRRQILSLVRLPVSPPSQPIFISESNYRIQHIE